MTAVTGGSRGSAIRLSGSRWARPEDAGVMTLHRSLVEFLFDVL